MTQTHLGSLIEAFVIGFFINFWANMLILHLNHYTHWIWKQDLHNLMHFLSLRDHSHAQVESQEYARAIDTLIRQHLPELMALYDKYRRMP